jgi:putative ABC transport system permease protein
VSIAAGVVFGLAPARVLGRLDVHGDLKQTSRGGTTAGQRRIRGALVAGEIALSLVLLIAAGLTIRSFIRLQQVPTGFAPDHVVTVRINPPPARYRTPEQRGDLYQRIVEALGAIPSVTSAGATSRLPLRSGNSVRTLMIAGVAPAVDTSADYRTASPGYFKTMGIPILRGRAFTDGDGEGRPLVAIVSASLAQRFLAGRDPIGAHLSIGDPAITIVGVAGDVHSASLAAPVQPTIYVPYRQDAFPFMTFVLRTAGSGDAAQADRVPAIQGDIRRAIRQIDAQLPADDIRTMDAQLSGSLSRQRFGVTLLTAFGVTASGLAAIGLYGVLAFIVAQRRREIGLRMALGATAQDVIRAVVGEGLRLAVLGVGAGLVLALASTRLISSLLFGTSPTDVATFAGVSVLLVVVAVAASLVPALRASRVAPLAALRED